MIVGNGLLAKAFGEFSDDRKIIIFASGVSNSLETNKKAFKREYNLLKSTINKHHEKTLVYFSTCSIYDKSVPHPPYIIHKLEMEGLVEKECNQFFILRLPNVVGSGGNEHTIFNYLVNCIKQDEEIKLWNNATRNILDVDDMFCIAQNILSNKMHNKIINIANSQDFKVSEIVKQIEKFYGKDAVLKIENKGEPVHIDISEFKENILSILSTEKQSIKYIPMLLNKYYK